MNREPLDTTVAWRGLRGTTLGTAHSAHDVRTLGTEVEGGDLVLLSGKVTVSGDDVPVTAVKLWTDVEGDARRGGGVCNILFVDNTNGLVVGSGRDPKESRAWRMARARALASGYTF